MCRFLNCVTQDQIASIQHTVPAQILHSTHHNFHKIKVGVEMVELYWMARCRGGPGLAAGKISTGGGGCAEMSTERFSGGVAFCSKIYLTRGVG
jgi:hypothetical protein